MERLGLLHRINKNGLISTFRYLDDSGVSPNIYSQGNEKCHYCKYGHFSIIYYSNLKSNSTFGQLIKFYVEKCPWMLNLVKYDGSYEGFKIKVKGISSFLSPSTEIENRYSVFSIFLVLLGNGFIFGQFLKSIPVLKSSGPQLSHGHIYFSFALSFFCMQ